MHGKARKILSLVLSFGLLFQQLSFAQVAFDLRIADHLSMMRSSLITEKFRPPQLRYFSYDHLNDNFKVLLDKGDLEKGLQDKGLPRNERGLPRQGGAVPDELLKAETKTLLNYFLIGIALQDSAFWVNLRPDSQDQIIDPNLGMTDIGKIMLEADLQLKKDTSSFTSPQTAEGREYWDKLYKKAEELYGNENITIPTLTRPWIVPGEIIVRESKESAYVYKANLKVMLEQDYLKDSTQYSFKDERSKTLNEYSSQLIRELIIPKLTREVNSSKRYAPLRQVYYSLVLSRWFKLRFKGQSGSYPSLIDTNNISNLTSQQAWSKTDYFQQYKKSFAQGEYNVKEPVSTPTGQVIRSYFSGGIKLDKLASSAVIFQKGISNTLINQKNIVSMDSSAAVDPTLKINLLPEGKGASVSSPLNIDENTLKNPEVSLANFLLVVVQDSKKNKNYSVVGDEPAYSNRVKVYLQALVHEFLNDVGRSPTDDEAIEFYGFSKDEISDSVYDHSNSKAHSFIYTKINNIPSVIVFRLEEAGIRWGDNSDSRKILPKIVKEYFREAYNKAQSNQEKMFAAYILVAWLEVKSKSLKEEDSFGDIGYSLRDVLPRMFLADKARGFINDWRDKYFELLPKTIYNVSKDYFSGPQTYVKRAVSNFSTLPTASSAIDNLNDKSSDKGLAGEDITIEGMASVAGELTKALRSRLDLPQNLKNVHHGDFTEAYMLPFVEEFCRAFYRYPDGEEAFEYFVRYSSTPAYVYWIPSDFKLVRWMAKNHAFGNLYRKVYFQILSVAIREIKDKDELLSKAFEGYFNLVISRYVTSYINDEENNFVSAFSADRKDTMPYKISVLREYIRVLLLGNGAGLDKLKQLLSKNGGEVRTGLGIIAALNEIAEFHREDYKITRDEFKESTDDFLKPLLGEYSGTTSAMILALKESVDTLDRIIKKLSAPLASSAIAEGENPAQKADKASSPVINNDPVMEHKLASTLRKLGLNYDFLQSFRMYSYGHRDHYRDPGYYLWKQSSDPASFYSIYLGQIYSEDLPAIFEITIGDNSGGGCLIKVNASDGIIQVTLDGFKMNVLGGVNKVAGMIMEALQGIANKHTSLRRSKSGGNTGKLKNDLPYNRKLNRLAISDLIKAKVSHANTDWKEYSSVELHPNKNHSTIGSLKVEDIRITNDGAYVIDFNTSEGNLEILVPPKKGYIEVNPDFEETYKLGKGGKNLVTQIYEILKNAEPDTITFNPDNRFKIIPSDSANKSVSASSAINSNNRSKKVLLEKAYEVARNRYYYGKNNGQTVWMELLEHVGGPGKDRKNIELLTYYFIEPLSTEVWLTFSRRPDNDEVYSFVNEIKDSVPSRVWLVSNYMKKAARKFIKDKLSLLPGSVKAKFDEAKIDAGLQKPFLNLLDKLFVDNKKSDFNLSNSQRVLAIKFLSEYFRLGYTIKGQSRYPLLTAYDQALQKLGLKSETVIGGKLANYLKFNRLAEFLNNEFFAKVRTYTSHEELYKELNEKLNKESKTAIKIIEDSLNNIAPSTASSAITEGENPVQKADKASSPIVARGMSDLKPVVKAKDIRQGFIDFDWNVSVKNGKVKNPDRIKQSIDSIEYFFKGLNMQYGFGLTHLGRPKAGEFDEESSLKPAVDVARELLRERGLLDVEVVLLGFNGGDLDLTADEITRAKEQYAGKKILFIFENIRFYTAEQSSDASIRKDFELALLKAAGVVPEDVIMINEAYDKSHRPKEASMELINLMPLDQRAAGISLEKEIMQVVKFVEAIKGGKLLVLSGGAKFDKYKQLVALAKKAKDSEGVLMLVGALAGVYLESKGVEIGASLMPENEKEIAAAQKGLKGIIDSMVEIVVPKDFVVAKVSAGALEIRPGSKGSIAPDEAQVDIGRQSIREMIAYIRDLKAGDGLIMNGGAGMFDKDAMNGTLKLVLAANAAAKRGASVFFAGADMSKAVDMIREEVRKTDPEFEFARGMFFSTGGGVLLTALGDGVENMDLIKAVSKIDETPDPQGKAGQPLAAEDFMIQIDYIMKMLGVKDVKRIIQTYRTSTDAVVLVKELSEKSNPRVSIAQVLDILDRIPFFAPISAYYRVKSTQKFDAREFQNLNIHVDVAGSNYISFGKQKDIIGQPISDYLKLMRDNAAGVPFVFRDNMDEYVGRFLGLFKDAKINPDLADIFLRITGYVVDNKIDLNNIKYFFSSGIGANEMYSHELARMVNMDFESRGISARWIVVNSAERLSIIPEDANDENSMVFEMSRGGNTQETLDFFNATKERFKKRVVVANFKKLNQLAVALSQDSSAKVMIVDDTPGEIGGRQMNRKTLMTYAPLLMALAVGLKDIDKAKAFLSGYVSALYDANEKLDYKNGLKSQAIGLAEFLFRHRESGRNKFSVMYDDIFKATSKELVQLLNEGGNKNIAGGTNDNILVSYSLQNDANKYKTVFDKAPHSQLPIFIVNSNGKDYAKTMEYVDSLRADGIPAIVIGIDLTQDLSANLRSLAMTTALLQDMVVYFTYITKQDANSNPAVKFVREITAAIFDIVKEKKSSGEAINISLDEVLVKIGEKQKSDTESAKRDIDGLKVVAPEYNKEFDSFKDALWSLGKTLGMKEDKIVALMVKSISKEVVMTDVGEAGGSNIANIKEAFRRSLIGESLGVLTKDYKATPLSRQQAVYSDKEMKISVASAQTQQEGYHNDASLAEQLAQYLFAMHKNKEYISLTFMEADEGNPAIKEISDYIVSQFAAYNITCPLLPLPAFAHAGIEAIMSHPDKAMNIVLASTNTYGNEIGRKIIDGNITLNDALYVYVMSNSLRMALGGTPSIFFELNNKEGLLRSKEIIIDALGRFKKMMQGESFGAAGNGNSIGNIIGNGGNSLAGSPIQLVDGAEIITITNKNIKPKSWETAGNRGDQTDPNDFSIDNVSRQTAGFAEEVLERMAKGEYKPINGETVRAAFAFDSRKHSDEYAEAMAKVLAAYKGFEVDIIDEAIPTPIAARLTQKDRPGAYDFVFHVTPSHNQLQYGGIKLLTVGSVNEHMWTYFFEKRANAKMEYPINNRIQLKRIRVVDQLTEEYFKEVFPGLIEKFASFKQLNPDAQFVVDLMDGSMASFAHLFQRLGMTVVRSGRMKDIDYSGRSYILADGKRVGFAPDPTQSAFYKDEPEFQTFLQKAPNGSVYFIIDGDGDRLVTNVKLDGKLNTIKPNQFGPLAADYIFTHKLLPGVNQIVRTYVTSAGMDAVARYHGFGDPVIVPVGSKYFNRFVPSVIALEESGHFVAGSFFDDTIFQLGLILRMMSETNKDVFTLLAETQQRTGYKGVDKRDDFENLSVDVKQRFVEPLTGTPEEVRVKSKKAVDAIVALSGKELLEALVVVEGENGVGRVVKLEEYVDSLFTDNPLKIEGSNRGIIIRFTDLSWGGARLSGTGNTGRLYTEGRESPEERQKIADAFISVLDLPKASSALMVESEDNDTTTASSAVNYSYDELPNGLLGMIDKTIGKAKARNDSLIKVIFEGHFIKGFSVKDGEESIKVSILELINKVAGAQESRYELLGADDQPLKYAGNEFGIQLASASSAIDSSLKEKLEEELNRYYPVVAEKALNELIEYFSGFSGDNSNTLREIINNPPGKYYHIFESLRDYKVGQVITVLEELNREYFLRNKRDKVRHKIHRPEASLAISSEAGIAKEKARLNIDSYVRSATGAHFLVSYSDGWQIKVPQPIIALAKKEFERVVGNYGNNGLAFLGGVDVTPDGQNLYLSLKYNDLDSATSVGHEIIDDLNARLRKFASSALVSDEEEVTGLRGKIAELNEKLKSGLLGNKERGRVIDELIVAEDELSKLESLPGGKDTSLAITEGVESAQEDISTSSPLKTKKIVERKDFFKANNDLKDTYWEWMNADDWQVLSILGFKIPGRLDFYYETFEREIEIGFKERKMKVPNIIKEDLLNFKKAIKEAEPHLLQFGGRHDSKELLEPVARAFNKLHRDLVEFDTRSLSSSSIDTPDRTGGIDFRALPMSIQPMGSFTGLNFQLPQLSPADLARIDINTELTQIENMVKSGISPSGSRIKELVAACVQKGQISQYADSLLLDLIEICKMEEENAYESSPELREALVIVDSAQQS